MLFPPMLLACSRVGTVEVQTRAGATVEAPPPQPPSSFQGQVAQVLPAGDEFVVAVQVVWAPVLEAARSERRVIVDPDTRWEPSEARGSQLQVGDEVQVQAHGLADGRWRALEVMLLDVD